jgi:hypothetical protein
MASVPGSGTLKRSRHTCLATSLQESAGISLPASFVEIYRNKPTGIVLSQWIDADCLLPEQVISHHIIA